MLPFPGIPFAPLTAALFILERVQCQNTAQHQPLGFILEKEASNRTEK